MRRGVVALFAILLAVGCTRGADGREPASPSGPAPASAVAAGPAASPLPGGCGTTPLRSGGLPAWTASAGPPDLPSVMSHEGNLAGVVFGHPLMSPPAQSGRQNKILWIVREPRNGSDLVLTLTPAGGGREVTLTEPPGSSPGEIYPSIVDVPAPGCWEVVAEWDGHRATLELSYVARPAGR
jgi:hypothetical protein